MVAVALGAVGALVVVGGALWAYASSQVEQPDYTVVRAEGDIEIRDYPALVVAEIVTQGDRDTAVRRGFGPLARYIFAKERGGDKIAMTAPVTQTPDDDAPQGSSAQGDKIAMTAPVTQTPADETPNRWTVRFIMPSEYALDDLPAPAGQVTLDRMPPRRVAAIRFSGWATDASVAEQTQALRRFLDREGLSPAGPPTVAYYNDPFVPGPLRRNEVMLPLRHPEDAAPVRTSGQGEQP